MSDEPNMCRDCAHWYLTGRDNEGECTAPLPFWVGYQRPVLVDARQDATGCAAFEYSEADR